MIFWNVRYRKYMIFSRLVLLSKLLSVLLFNIKLKQYKYKTPSSQHKITLTVWEAGVSRYYGPKIPFGSKSKGKLSPRSYPIQFERKCKCSFLSVGRPKTNVPVWKSGVRVFAPHSFLAVALTVKSSSNFSKLELQWFRCSIVNKRLYLL